MKRIISLMFILSIALMSIVLVSASCSSENDPINPDDTVQTDDTSQTDDTDQTDDSSQTNDPDQTDDSSQTDDTTGTDDGSDSAVDNNEENTEFMNQIEVKVNGYTLTATLVDNSSTRALVDLLKDGDITIEAHDYGNFEKVGSLPESLPRNDEEITTSAGDIILYLGTSICFYYSTNTWDFTRLGRIDNAESYDLAQIYGSGDATFVLSLP